MTKQGNAPDPATVDDVLEMAAVNAVEAITTQGILTALDEGRTPMPPEQHTPPSGIG